MRKSLFLFYFAFFYHSAHSQPSSRAGQVAANFYHYPKFTSGKVYFKTGQTTEARLNYNIALEEMHFLNKNGDTLALANAEALQVILIGTDSFYYNKGYLKIVETYNNLKLVSKQKRSSETQKQRGAYGENITGTAIDNINTYQPADRASIKLNSNEVSYSNFEVSYFIMDANSKYIPVSKKNILKYFPNHKNEIESYITTNSLSFENEVDIKNVLMYASLLK